MLAATGTESDLYKLVLLLHILGIIAGIGGLTLNALYGAQARKRPGPAGRAVVEANYAVGSVAEWIVYSILITGALLVLLSDDAWSFGDFWIWSAVLVYVAAVGLSHGVARKNQRRLIALLGEMESAGPPVEGPPPQAGELGRIGQQQQAIAMIMPILTIVLVALMVWKPGA